MSEIERWTPGERFRDFWGRFFDDPRGWFPEVWSARGLGYPAFDVYETGKSMVLKAELPGYKPEDISIMVYPDHATVSGKSREESEEKGVSYHRRERRMGQFERTVAFPVEVKSEEATATFEHGVLEVRVPKVDDTSRHGKRVEIQTPKIH